MNTAFAHAIAEEFVDWLLEENSPNKQSLTVFSLSLTPDGMAVRNAILNVLRPLMISHEGGVYGSNASRETLLKLANLAIQRMHHESQTLAS